MDLHHNPPEIPENFDQIFLIRIYLSSVLAVYHRLFVDNESLSSLMEQNMLKRYVVLLKLVTAYENCHNCDDFCRNEEVIFKGLKAMKTQ